MSALAHFIEEDGIPTTGISLVREHTAGYRPPRFLWVPFPLGRPFGAPHAPAFQRRVLGAALALLERDDGPVILEDFPDDAPAAPAGESEPTAWVCPVSFPAPPRDPRDLRAALADEVRGLAPWHALARERRGRTTVGLSGKEPPALVALLATHLDGAPPAPGEGASAGERLKLACEDLKAYYQEAATARPGAADAHAIAEWLWGETALGRVFLELAPRLAASDDPELRLLARDYFIPRVQAHRLGHRPSGP